METVNFTQMKNGTQEEYVFLQKLEHDYIRALPDRLLVALERLGGSLQGYKLSRLEHSLQSASRAEDDGADIEMIVAALVHDLGDELAPENHSQFAADILKPYVRAEVTWVVEMHGLFQMQYYAHHYGKPADGHLVHKDHPWFDSCQRFVELYDQAAFDPAYPTRPLSYFEPMLREVFTRPAFAQSQA
ncbi:peptidase [Rhodoferax lacus]|jgi:predicted HD phosphohydrolase|uniref:Peptidase n=1 Tax=Rhodoferax lacus TaxID=2184758 RepID=A0A3E1R8H4_9BURK|nr:HD domain-containing protein [Rhodoferax lacus]RFO95543.1 peptidase [Rhodoferax lacus]